MTGCRIVRAALQGTRDRRWLHRGADHGALHHVGERPDAESRGQHPRSRTDFPWTKDRGSAPSGLRATFLARGKTASVTSAPGRDGSGASTGSHAPGPPRSATIASTSRWRTTTAREAAARSSEPARCARAGVSLHWLTRGAGRTDMAKIVLRRIWAATASSGSSAAAPWASSTWAARPGSRPARRAQDAAAGHIRTKNSLRLLEKNLMHAAKIVSKLTHPSIVQIFDVQRARRGPASSSS